MRNINLVINQLVRNVIIHLILHCTRVSLDCSDDDVLRVPWHSAFSEASVFVRSNGAGDPGDRGERMILGPHGVDEVFN